MNKIKKILTSDSDSNVSSGTNGTATGNSGSTHSTNTSGLSSQGVDASNSASTTGANTGSHPIGGSVGNAESDLVNGTHNRTTGAPSNPAHSHNTKHNSVLDEAAAATATHDHKHVSPITQEQRHHHETEEVQRERNVDRHIHHVQHHVQPVTDTHHHAQTHTEQVHPTSHVHEQHVNTTEDQKLFAGLNKHKDSVTHGAHERTVVDRGEIVNTQDTHHVHHVVQPVIQRDTHSHNTIHTTIPVNHTTHEAPIIHQSQTHEPMHIKDFVAGGGDIKSKLTHNDAGVLQNGECERTSTGPVEGLVQSLHLGKGGHTAASSGATGATAAV